MTGCATLRGALVTLLVTVIGMSRVVTADCASSGPPATAIASQQIAALFRGRVVDVAALEPASLGDAVTFEVDTVWKGIVPRVITIYNIAPSPQSMASNAVGVPLAAASPALVTVEPRTESVPPSQSKPPWALEEIVELPTRRDAPSMLHLTGAGFRRLEREAHYLIGVHHMRDAERSRLGVANDRPLFAYTACTQDALVLPAGDPAIRALGTGQPPQAQ